MDKIPFRPIGERFNFGDVALEVVNNATNDDCVGCYFYRPCEKFVSVIGHCYSEDREDGADIIFRKVKESEQKKAQRFINDRLSMGSLDFTAADVVYCVTCAEKEAKERMQAKAHRIIEKMMAGIFQGDMSRKIADEFCKKLTEE